MLVSTLSTREIMLKTYEEAVKQKYRFFSFAMPCSLPIIYKSGGK